MHVIIKFKVQNLFDGDEYFVDLLFAEASQAICIYTTS